MKPTTEKLTQAALALPEDDRAELAETLIASLETDETYGLDEACLEEIKRRSEEYDNGLAKTVTWDEVKRRTRENHGFTG